MEAHPATRQTGTRIRIPRALLRRLDDERLVELVQSGHAAAFEVIYERMAPGLLGYSRQLLGIPADAEDAVQHAFAALHQHVEAGRELRLKPWLYTVARNRCVSILRARGDQPLEEAPEPSVAGLSEVVQQSEELRDVLRDLAGLPEDQRSALVLSELGDLSHGDVAEVLDCEQQKVKALVFQARSALMVAREARDTDCSSIREQLATLTGGALRRKEIREHLRSCPGCREYRDEVRRQRRALAVVRPVVPSAALNNAVLGSLGVGGGIGGGASLAGGAGTAIGTKAVAALVVVGTVAGGVGLVVGAGHHEASRPEASKAVSSPETEAPGEASGKDGSSESGKSRTGDGSHRPGRGHHTHGREHGNQQHGGGQKNGNANEGAAPAPAPAPVESGAPGQGAAGGPSEPSQGEIRSSEVSKGTGGAAQSGAHSQTGGSSQAGGGNSIKASNSGGSGGGNTGGNGGQTGGGGGGNSAGGQSQRAGGNAHSQKPDSPPGKPDKGE